MPQLTKRSFTSGEITPALHDRVDVTKYATGLAACRNFFVKAQGGVANRPGFSFIGASLDGNRKCRIIEFEFSTSQTYILLFEHLTVRFIQSGGFVVDGSDNVYQISSPYTEDDLEGLDYAQSADVMTLVHPNHPNNNLIRLDNDEWELNQIDYTAPNTSPVWVDNTTGTVTAIAISGNLNGGDSSMEVTVSGNHGLINGQSVAFNFDRGIINRQVEEPESGVIDDTSQVDVTIFNDDSFIATFTNTSSFIVTIPSLRFPDLDLRTFTTGTFSTGGLLTTGDSDSAGSFRKTYTYKLSAIVGGVESLPSDSRNLRVNSLSVTFGVRLTWNEIDDVDYYRVYKESGEGTGVFGWIGDSVTGNFTDFNIAPITSDAPIVDNDPFADGNNPSTVGYYQQRQIFANTTNNPQTFYASKTADYNSFRFSRPSRDDDSITFTLASNKLNEIRHIVALNSLVLLTSGGEWLVSEGQDKVLTPATTGVRIQSYNGASKVKPEVINNTVVYVQNKGSRIRNLGYEFSSDSYTGNNLSIMSEHLFEGHTIIDMAYADEPYGILWCVRDDGVLLGLTYLKEHDVWGWHVHTTDGLFESIATVSEGNEDVLYAVIQREVNSQTVRYVERLNTRVVIDVEEGIFLDSSLSYDGVPVTTFSGLDHLEGKTLTALADGNVIRNLTVSSGQVSIEHPASKIHIGLEYDQYIDTLDVDSNSESLKAKNISVSKVFISMNRSRGGFVSAKRAENDFMSQTELKPRFQSDGYDSIQLKSYVDEVIIDSNWSKSGGVRVLQNAPLPMEILSITPEFDIGG